MAGPAAWLRALIVPISLLMAAPAWALGWVGCQDAPRPNAAQVDRALQLSALVQEELTRSAPAVAVISRSGLALQRLGHLHSHAGFAFSAPAAPEAPTQPQPSPPPVSWQVRQLYVDCGASQPSLFDEGLPGFVLGASAHEVTRIALVMLPQQSAQALAAQVRDADAALSLLGARYSANAHAWSTRHQNCNQWVAEMLGLSFAPAPQPSSGSAREQAQASLRTLQARPSIIAWPILLPGWMIESLPYLSLSDHPQQDLQQRQFQVWMPRSIETLIRTLQPQSQRVEFCQVGARIVVRRSWQPVQGDCIAQDGDRVIALDGPPE